MCSKKDAPAGAGTPTGAGEKGSQSTTTFSDVHSTTGRESGQGGICSLLSPGAENAVSAADLMRLCGFGSVRELQKSVESERAAGFVILSSPSGGYFLPDSGEKGRQEIESFLRTLRARALNTLKSMRSAKMALRRYENEGQMSLTERSGGECGKESGTAL